MSLVVDSLTSDNLSAPLSSNSTIPDKATLESLPDFQTGPDLGHFITLAKRIHVELESKDASSVVLGLFPPGTAGSEHALRVLTNKDFGSAVSTLSDGLYSFDLALESAA